MYRLQISLKAAREIKKIKKIHKYATILALQDIKENPLLGKPLTRNLTEKFSYRVGVYRIVYKVNEKDRVVDILTAGHRLVIYN